MSSPLLMNCAMFQNKFSVVIVELGYLENSHLGSGILHGHAIRLEIEIAFACGKLLRVWSYNRKGNSLTADDLGVGGVFKMAVHNLLSEGEGAAEALANDGDVLVEPFVVDGFGRLQLAVGNIGER